MTSCWSPYSALDLVRHRIHTLRQSTELLKKLTFFWRCLHVARRVQRYAWFNRLWRLVLLVTVHFALFSLPVRRPRMLCIMGGMVQKDSCSGMARLVLLVRCVPWLTGP